MNITNILYLFFPSSSLALFPHAAFFNHDCNRNCEATQLVGDDGKLSAAEEMPAAAATLDTNLVETCQKQASSQEEETDEGQPKAINAPSVFDAPRGAFRLMIIRTLRAAEAGKPLCISYIDFDQPVAARRRKLLEEYFFECMCDRCVEESQVKPKSKRGGNRQTSNSQKQPTPSNKPPRIDGL